MLMPVRRNLPWLLCCAMGCDGTSPGAEVGVDRLVWRVQDATVSSILENPGAFPPPSAGRWFVRAEAGRGLANDWYHYVVGAPELARANADALLCGGALRRQPGEGRLVRVVPAVPNVVLQAEAEIRVNGHVRGGQAPLYVLEHTTRISDRKLGVAQPWALHPTPLTEVEERPHADGFKTYRLVWRSGLKTKALSFVFNPDAISGVDAISDGTVELRSLRLRRATPEHLAPWLWGRDPPFVRPRSTANGNYQVRLESGAQTADALLAVPPSRFRFPLRPGARDRVAVGFCIPPGQATGDEGDLVCRIVAETPSGDVSLESFRASPPSQPEVPRVYELSATLPPEANSVRLETLRADPDAPGMVPAYLVDPVVFGSGVSPRWNVVLISIDTLRADRLRLYGYHRRTTPFLDEFAADCIVFEQNIAPAAYTLPSHVSLLSGQYPRVHGVMRVQDRIAADRTPLLSQMLARVGYRTAGFSGGVLVHSSFGYQAGFDRYSNRDPVCRDGIEPILDWISISGEQPFFLFAHTYNVHDFVAAEDLAEQFHPGPCESRLHGHRNWGEVNQRNGARPEDRRHVSELYDAAVATADRFVQRIIERLREQGQLERTVVVITSDHGKELWDRGWLAHGHDLFEEMIHVPLIIYAPGISGRRCTEVVSSVDVVPTILDLLCRPRAPNVQGESLVPLLKGGTRPARPVLSEQINAPFHKISLRAQRAKFLRRELIRGTDWRGELAREYFDLVADPGETHGGFDRDPRAPRLEQKLDVLLAELDELSAALDQNLPPSQTPAMRPDVEQALREVGYIH